MNKYFALSLLLLSSSIAYGMEEKQNSCESLPVRLDIEIKLPENFKERLTKDSQTTFTVDFDARKNDVGYSILGLRLDENSSIKVRTGKGTIGMYQECVDFLAFRNVSTHADDIKMRFANLIGQRGMRRDSLVDQYCTFNNKTTITIPKVGNMLSAFDASFTPGDVEVTVAARLINESVAEGNEVKNPFVKYDDSVYEKLKETLEMNKEQLMLKMLSNEK